ncbi:ATP-binding protein [Bradyrhizobium sp.]|jgi:anti-sigma regulatory factor (Ser/Thr protein kinase)|uniref:ATP-binding protein n=1 Tax=Bradyrhizobium sp. TaxID=376 RepID=UPI003C279C18
MLPVQDLQQHCATRWDGASEATLTQSLAAPATACIEAGLLVDDGPDHAGNGSCLSLTVSVRSIYREAIAGAFVRAIDDRLRLSRELRDRIVTALHEALLNAVMHGHLKLEAGLRDTLGGFETAHETIVRQLASQQYAQSRVVIAAQWGAGRLLIAVHDNGVGFDPDKNRSRQRGCGRGLAVVEAFCDSVTHLDGGRTIVLGFEL